MGVHQHNGGRTQSAEGDRLMKHAFEFVYAAAFVSAVLLGIYKLLCFVLGVA